MEYAVSRGIPIPITLDKPYSIDRTPGATPSSVEMEDLWVEPPEDAWRMTQNPTKAPAGSPR